MRWWRICTHRPRQMISICNCNIVPIVTMARVTNETNCKLKIVNYKLQIYERISGTKKHADHYELKPAHFCPVRAYHGARQRPANFTSSSQYLHNSAVASPAAPLRNQSQQTVVTPERLWDCVTYSIEMPMSTAGRGGHLCGRGLRRVRRQSAIWQQLGGIGCSG